MLCEKYTLAFDKNAFDEVSLEIIKDALLKHQDARIEGLQQSSLMDIFSGENHH